MKLIVKFEDLLFYVILNRSNTMPGFSTPEIIHEERAE